MNEEQLKAKIKELEDEIEQLIAANGSDQEKAKRLQTLNKRLADRVEELSKVEKEKPKGMTFNELLKGIKEESLTNEEIVRFGIENADKLGLDTSKLQGENPEEKFNYIKGIINDEFRKGGI